VIIVPDLGSSATGAFELLRAAESRAASYVPPTEHFGYWKTLTQAFPDALTKDEVAAKAGYEPNGGGFSNALAD